jgi:hypothetical protein
VSAALLPVTFRGTVKRILELDGSTWDVYLAAVFGPRHWYEEYEQHVTRTEWMQINHFLFNCRVPLSSMKPA